MERKIDSYAIYLGQCEIDYLTYVSFQDKDSHDFFNLTLDMLIVNWRVKNLGVSPSYQLRFYKFKIKEDLWIEMELMNYALLPQRIDDVKISKSSVEKNQFDLLVLTESVLQFDTTIFLLKMNYTNEELVLSGYSLLTGFSLGFDQFKVNSVMFIPNQNYFLVAIDDFGLALIDIIRIEVADTILFKDLFGVFYKEFTIASLIPICEKEIRVLLETQESFWIYWDDILVTPINGHIINNPRARNRFVNVKSQIATEVVDYSDQSIVQVISYVQKGGFYDGFIRVYNHMNRDKSKSYREYRIGRVPRWIYINYNSELQRILVIWGAKYYIYNVWPYPYLNITDNNDPKGMDLELIADNGYSNITVEVLVGSHRLSVHLAKWIVILIFISILFVSILVSAFLLKLFNFVFLFRL